MITLILLLILASVHSDIIETKNKRQQLLENEMKLSIGENIVLSEDEKKLDKILMKWKLEEFDYWFKNNKYYNFSKSFFEYKEDIERSRVYQLIKIMPKAGLLHVHANAILGAEFFMNVTYRDNLFVCLSEDPKFKFSYLLPKDSCDFKWQKLSDIRSAVNITQFDYELKSNFTLVGSYYKDIDEVWKHFSSIFAVIRPILKHRPVWEEYMFEALRKLRDDKIFYVEFRCMPYELYELDGTVHDETYFVILTENIVARFKRDYPDFLGAKIIISYGRLQNDIEKVLKISRSLKEQSPSFVAGFDLNGREDLGGPLINYLEILEKYKEAIGGYYFHAGETNWYGTYADENLLDAVVLKSKRIGHGFALLKHPLVLDEIQKSGTCVEISVISNNVLGHGEDIRLHPISSLVARGINVTITGDDPGFWGARPVSADFYVAFSALSRRHGLAMLKKLALNSLHCSAMTETEKAIAFEKFKGQWSQFVSDSLARAESEN